MNSLYNKYLRSIKFFLGRVVDFDGKYANQCVDWIKAYAKSLCYRITTNGNAKDFAYVGLGKNWSKVNGEPWVGDIVIFPTGTYGHIAVFQHIIGNSIYVIDQNADGNAYKDNDKKNLGSPIKFSKYRLRGNEVYFRVNA